MINKSASGAIILARKVPLPGGGDDMVPVALSGSGAEFGKCASKHLKTAMGLHRTHTNASAPASFRDIQDREPVVTNLEWRPCGF